MKRAALVLAWALDKAVAFFAMLGARQRATLRSMDLTILWPVCKDQAPDIALARLAFMVHAPRDPAWTKDFTKDEIIAVVETLT